MTKTAKLTKKDLVLLLKQKNENAFSLLYDDYAPLIYGIILREVKNDALASEILKSTFINIFKESKNIDCVKQSLFTWLLSVTKKTAAAGFEVNIDLKSPLLPQKLNSENYLKKNINYQTGSNSSSYPMLTRTI
ncbi:MAG: polymerase sigma-70 factor [Segetibacter sp.]|nr:polymerase sigma-70 factor [Segetibacter sp.]